MEVPGCLDVEQIILDRCKEVGLDVQTGGYLVLGRQMVAGPPPAPLLDRQRAYALSDLDSVSDAAAALADLIVGDYGPGRVWFAARPGYAHRRGEAGPGETSTRVEVRAIQGPLDEDGNVPTEPVPGGKRRVLLAAYFFHQPTAAVAPLDAEYDGCVLRDLLALDELARRDTPSARVWTPAQRAAVSAHWSAELRTRTQGASK
jgi:hypothetical protein